MATNYNLVLESEKKLKKMILNYVKYCGETHKRMWNKVWNVVDNHTNIDSVYRKIKTSESMERDLIDECIWIISKDSPKTNHLRIIVSIIYQAKDIEIAITYALSMIKIIDRKQINIEDLTILEPLVKRYLEVIDELWDLYKDNKLKEKNETAKEISHNFLELSFSVNKTLKEKYSQKDIEDKYFPLSMIIKNIESTIERLKTIFSIISYNDEY
ncbi:MAG: hypothetical protein ACRCRZ_03185 [Metamycoplasmataceae bacterium]